MSVRLSKADIASLVVLVVLVTFEVFFKKDELFRSIDSLICMAIGLVIGVNIGYKLFALHVGHLTQKVCATAEACEVKLQRTEKEQTENERDLKIALKRAKKLTKALARSLEERDEEVKELIRRKEP